MNNNKIHLIFFASPVLHSLFPECLTLQHQDTNYNSLELQSIVLWGLHKWFSSLHPFASW